MSTPHRLSTRDDTAPVAEVRTRRTRAAAAGRETYGAENLPVLIRLPDLATARPQVAVVGGSREREAEDVPAAVSVPSVAAVEPQPIDAGLEPLRGTETQCAAAPTGYGRAGRGTPRPTPARPSEGAGQLLWAVVLAGVLFAVIVTVKEWNQTPRGKAEPSRDQHVRIPDLNEDFQLRQPLQTPATDVFPSPPELAPAANALSAQPSEPSDVASTLSAQPSEPSDVALERDAPVAPEAVGYADGVEQDAGGVYSSYPSTGVDMVEPARAGATEVGWPPATDRSLFRNAERSLPDAQYQQR